MSILYAFIPGSSGLNYLQRIANSTTDALLYLTCHIFFSYGLMYFVIPHYVIKGKYTFAAIWSLILILATGALSAVVSLYVLVPVKEFILPSNLIAPPPPAKYADLSVFHLALIAGLRGAITVGGLAAAIKLMKHWYVEGQKNIQLQRENIESRLQLLKAQVHPHFLFNTLNNIYSKTQNIAPVASEMIFGLSDILRYILYECNKPVVPLSQELAMIDEYMKLEKIRYGNRLELHVDLPESTQGYFIAPLLILPFVENCFKHGTSNILEQPWINLIITLEKETMTLKLLNSKSPVQMTSNGHGIGIENVKRRLSLLYPGKHQLIIQEEEEVFIVTLKLQLEKRTMETVAANRPTYSSIIN
jgi:Histidine kinase